MMRAKKSTASDLPSSRPHESAVPLQQAADQSNEQSTTVGARVDPDAGDRLPISASRPGRLSSLRDQLVSALAQKPRPCASKTAQQSELERGSPRRVRPSAAQEAGGGSEKPPDEGWSQDFETPIVRVRHKRHVRVIDSTPRSAAAASPLQQQPPTGVHLIAQHRLVLPATRRLCQKPISRPCTLKLELCRD